MYKDAKLKINAPPPSLLPGRPDYPPPSQTTLVEGNVVTPVSQTLHFKTQTEVPRVGVMLVGLGGNNGSTVAAGILANQNGLTWNTKVIFLTEKFGRVLGLPQNSQTYRVQ